MTARRPELTSVEPILAGFHPDPSVCRAHDAYYLANSSFEYRPGVPIWRSPDLLAWEQLGNAITGASRPARGVIPSSQGLYAPTLRFHDDRFWLVVTDVPAGGGHLLLHAKDPAGPWSEPVTITGLHGIDPDLAWDDDGTCYLSYCSALPGLQGIAQARVDLERGVALEQPRLIWRGTGLAFPEAPHLYPVDGWWYLLIAEGGTERGHSVCVARAPSPTGPFVGGPVNPVFSHRSLTHRVQNVGHGDLVRTSDGSWAMAYLGVRAAGTTPGFHVNGRETFLVGVDWVDGWPVVDEERYAAPPPDRSFDDDFTGPSLHPRWVSPGDGLALAERSGLGAVTLRASADDDPRHGLFTRTLGPRWTFDAHLHVEGGTAGVVLRMDDRHLAEVRVGSGRATAHLRIGPLASQVGRTGFDGDHVVVRVAAVDPLEGGPDDVVLSVVRDGTASQLARFDGRYLSTEVAGGFTGRVLGVRAVRGRVRLDRAGYRVADVPD